MLSDLRVEIFSKMEEYSNLLNLEGKKVLEVGIAGDPKPGGNFQYFGEGNEYETMDIDGRYSPNYVADIRETKLTSDKFDLIILSQTIEHMSHPEQAIGECYRLLKDKGCLIVDSPWMYPYHPDDDFDDYARYSDVGLEQMCREHRFKTISKSLSNNLATCLVRK
jgi:SAM-dependent methyltransferase